MVGKVLLWLLAWGLTSAYGQQPKLLVNTKQGRVLGKEEYGVRVWKGIPYGQASRWRDSRPPPSFSGVQERFEFGPQCPQFTTDAPMSEDCLFLNVYAPLAEPSGKGEIAITLIHSSIHPSY
jgi:para-nitrobenzyl esterase